MRYSNIFLIISWKYWKSEIHLTRCSVSLLGSKKPSFLTNSSIFSVFKRSSTLLCTASKLLVELVSTPTGDSGGGSTLSLLMLRIAAMLVEAEYLRMIEAICFLVAEGEGLTRLGRGPRCNGLSALPSNISYCPVSKMSCSC